jgi:hypothetical protein
VRPGASVGAGNQTGREIKAWAAEGMSEEGFGMGWCHREAPEVLPQPALARGAARSCRPTDRCRAWPRFRANVTGHLGEWMRS